MTSFTFGRSKMVWKGYINNDILMASREMAYMLILGSVGALLVHQRQVILHDAGFDKVVQVSIG